MTNPSEKIAEVLDLNGGSLVGKTRLQKTLYFLEAANSGYGFDFQYYHYGPYSEELSVAADEAILLGSIEQKWAQSNKGHPYAVLRLGPNYKPEEKEKSEIKAAILKLLDQYDPVSLELGATAHFLRDSGYKDYWQETKIRKASKASPERLEKAKKLLTEFENIQHQKSRKCQVD